MWGEGGVEQRPKGICGAVFGRWGTGTRQAKRTGVYHTALEEFPLATQVSTRPPVTMSEKRSEHVLRARPGEGEEM